MAHRLIIRAEDKNRWERRTPLVPDHVRNLVQKHGLPIAIEPSSLRIFPDSHYIDAGASQSTTSAPGDVIIGVKEIPPARIEADRTYLFFSHTIKGQAANMPALRRIMESGSTLLDYEKILDDAGRRLIFFGKFAGDAGAVDILWLIGREMKRRGIDTPLSRIRQALNYASLSEAKKEIKAVGEEVAANGFPAVLSPFVVGVFGYGNVSRGAQEILDLFRVHRISPSDLADVKARGELDNRTLYLVVFHEYDMVRRRDGESFDLTDYYENPEDYEAITESYLPFFKLIVNAVYWTDRYPRFVTQDMVRRLWASSARPSFYAIADISCDIRGAVELTVKSTESGHPDFTFLPRTGTIQDEPSEEGILMLTVDNLPCEFAADASLFFSTLLEDFLPSLCEADFSLPLTECGLLPELQRAVIVQKGVITPDFRYLEDHLAASE